MYPAALQATALQQQPDRVGEAHMSVADHQLDASEAAFLEPIQLAAQHRARGFSHGRPVGVPEVAKDQRRTGKPGHQPERGRIGQHLKITETRIPIGDGKPIQRIHVEVDREQVAAAMGSVGHHRLQKMACVETLAHESAKRIGDGHEDRIDGTRFNLGLELLESH